MRKSIALLLAAVLLCAMLPAVGEEAVEAVGLTGIRVRDAAQSAVLSAEFDPVVTDYWVYVQADAYGIEFTPTGADVVINGAAIADGEAFVYELPQEQETHYDTWFGNVEIAYGDVTYNYNVVREDPGAYTTDAFKLNTWKLPDGKEMYYWLYVPENYDSSREYPVVLYLHGAGQSTQHIDQVLLANTGAGAFVKYQHEAIVIAPQRNYTDLSVTEFMGWANTDGTLSIFGQGAYDILQHVKSEYSVDENREYVTGLSMGGGGTYGMLINYPYEFAGAMANCGFIGFTNDEQWDILAKAVKDGGTQLLLTHGTGDPKVNFTNFQSVTAALERVNAPYYTDVYSPDDFLWPNRHWCWAPAYANQDNLNWLMNQSRSNVENELLDLRVDESTQRQSIAFKPDVKEYEMRVQYDTYGVRVTPYGKGVFNVNGNEVKGGESYIFQMTEEHGDYDKEMHYYIGVSDASETYTIHIIREDNAELLNAFEMKQWTLKDGKQMNYWLHVPEDYDAAKSYPVILSLHGAGQRYQNPKMVLQRYVHAYAPIKYGYDCIVIAPQCNYTDLSQDSKVGWAGDDVTAPSIFGEASYDILQSIKSEYNVDEKREYITGLSMGAMGTHCMLTAYPDEFAGALLIAGCAEATEDQWKMIADANIPMWFTIHIDDIYKDLLMMTLDAYSVLDGLNYENFNLTIYPNNIYLAPNGHFSQIPFYATPEVLEWLFNQSK